MLNYNEFGRDIKQNSLKPAYLFLGDEEYLMQDAIDNIKTTYINPSFEEINYATLEGKNLELEDLINACETLPFMSEKRMVVLKDIGSFIKNLNDNEKDSLYTYLKDLGDFMCLILLDNNNSVDGRMKITRELRKTNQVVDFSKLENRDLETWIYNICKDNGKKISPANTAYFISRSSYNSRNIDKNLYDLENELLKVIDHSIKDEIEKEDIDSVLIESIDTNIFQLLDSISTFNVEKAIELLDDMYLMNEPIQRIFYMINRQIRLIFSYKVYSEKGYPENMIMRKLNISEFEFRKIRNQSRKFSIEKLTRIMEELLKMDIKFKTTSTDERLLMEMFIVRICS